MKRYKIIPDNATSKQIVALLTWLFSGIKSSPELQVDAGKAANGQANKWD